MTRIKKAAEIILRTHNGLSGVRNLGGGHQVQFQRTPDGIKLSNQNSGVIDSRQYTDNKSLVEALNLLKTTPIRSYPHILYAAGGARVIKVGDQLIDAPEKVIPLPQRVVKLKSQEPYIPPRDRL